MVCSHPFSSTGWSSVPGRKCLVCRKERHLWYLWNAMTSLWTKSLAGEHHGGSPAGTPSLPLWGAAARGALQPKPAGLHWLSWSEPSGDLLSPSVYTSGWSICFGQHFLFFSLSFCFSCRLWPSCQVYVLDFTSLLERPQISPLGVFLELCPCGLYDPLYRAYGGAS